MRVIFRGKLDTIDMLAKGTLPPDAIKLKEPNNFKQINIWLIPYIVLSTIFILLIKELKCIVDNTELFEYNISLLGLLLFVVSIPIHELLHAICFPQNANVEIWYNIRKMLVLCFSITPIKKSRFILMSLLPTLVLSVIPLLVWFFLDFENETYSRAIFFYCLISFICGSGDYMNVVHALQQVPNGASIQMSGINNYWYK